MHSITLNPAGIPQELQDLNRWVLWRRETRDGKPTKVPYQPNAVKAASSDPTTWSSFDTVVERFDHYDGIGFVFSSDDDLMGIDLDGCRNPETGELDPWAQAIVDRFPTYTEVSPSGTGVKLIARGKLPTEKTGRKTKDGRIPGDGYGDKKPGIEAYHHGRYFAMTGVPFGEPMPIVDHDFTDWFNETFPPEYTPPSNNGHHGGDRLKLIERARQYLAKVDPAISGQRGHDRCYHAACIAVCGFGLKQHEALDAMAEWNARCEPPWSEKELCHKLTDAATTEEITLWALNGKDPPKKFHQKDGKSNGQNDHLIDPPAQYQPFPLDVLPDVLARFVEETAASIGCDPSFVALPALASLAGAIGNRAAIVIKSDWTEPATLWTAAIGGVSSMKSPAQEKATKPLYRVQQGYFNHYADAMHMYETEIADWEKTKKSERGEKPKPPACQRVLTQDATLEALIPILAENPEGIVSTPDELAGWLNSLNQYKGGKGGDRENWLSMHRAGPIVNDRKMGRQIYYVPRAAVSLCGTIQPNVFAKFANDPNFRDCGLTSRLLLAAPPPRKKRWSDHTVPEAVQDAYGDVIRNLLSLPMDRDEHDNPMPVFMGMITAAKDEYKAFVNSLADETADEDDEQVAGAWGKLEGYAARFALIFQLVHDPFSNVVQLWAMKNGITLARWFAQEAKRVYAMMGETLEQSEQRQLIELIRQHGGEITTTELMAAKRRYRDSGSADHALKQLHNAKLGTWEVVPTTGRPRTVFRLNSTPAGNGSPIFQL